jgi:tRNA/tmRNA/rRNA uracil-C5-methylase (TrmA/RlmC/RlmD family)
MSEIESPEIVRLGDEVEVVIDKVANGGFCIARHNGQVVFVRHGIPGERVRIEITEISKKFLRADVIEVLETSDHRVTAPCDYAGVCGGCDWQHVELAYQRELKSEVVREQLGHLGGITHVNGKPLAEFEVVPLSFDETGLRWRTRNRYSRIGDSAVGMKIPRSHSVVEINDCLIAVEGSVALAQEKVHLGRGDISTAQSSTGQHVVVDKQGGPWLDEEVGERSWRIHAGSFWQVHRNAPKVFVETVRRMSALKSGEKALDLYAGAGLFAASLAGDVTERGEVVAVESVIDAMRDARRSCSDLPQIDLITADVNKWITQIDEDFAVVILDPPRAGAGLEVITEIDRIATRSIVYVACEPSALGRDAKYLSEAGWSMTQLVGLDAFPMTGHVECIALFERF